MNTPKLKAQDLKNSILQYAIQGKLVPQDPNDEPASVLLERIKKEKQKLVKAGKIKADKTESTIFRGADKLHYESVDGQTRCIDDEIPFEIPDNWVWVRLGGVVDIQTGASFKKNVASKGKGEIRILRGGNIQPLKYDFKNDDLFIDHTYISDSILLQKNDLITPVVTSLENIGKIARIDRRLSNVTVGGFVFIFRSCFDSEILSLFLSYSISCPFFRDTLRSQANKSGQAFYNLGKERIKPLLLPLPPLSEQHRIVEKLEAVLPKVSEYDTVETRLTKYQESFPEVLKKSILQSAIQGKLVPQDPNDEPASVLLERIQKEKEKLVKAGKIKPEKQTSFIFRDSDNRHYEKTGNQTRCIDDEIPFEIPESWAWVRLGSIVQIGPRNTLADDLSVSFIPMTLIGDGYQNHHSSEERKWKVIKTGFTHFAEGDIGIAKITPCFENRKSVIFHGLLNGYGAGTTELHILRIYGSTVVAPYLLAFCKAPSFIIGGVDTYTGTAGQQRVGRDYMANILFPLPPITEQERIVKRIKQLFVYSDVM